VHKNPTPGKVHQDSELHVVGVNYVTCSAIKAALWPNLLCD